MTLKKLTLMTVCGLGLLVATTQTSQACCLFDWLFCCHRPTTCCFPPPTCCPQPCCPSPCSACGGAGCSACGNGCSSCGVNSVGQVYPGQVPTTYGTQYAPVATYGWNTAPVVVHQYPVARPSGAGFFGSWGPRPVARPVVIPAQTATPEPAYRQVDRRMKWEPILTNY